MPSDTPSAESSLQRGQDLLRAGRAEDSLVHFRRAARVTSSTDSRPIQFIGFAFGQLRRFHEAQHAYEQALVISPRDPRAYFNLGNAQLERRALEGAATAFTHTAQLAPTWPDPYVNLGVAMRADTAGSLAAFRHALALQPDHSSALANVVFASTWLGDWLGRSALTHALRERLDAARLDGDDDILVQTLGPLRKKN